MLQVINSQFAQGSGVVIVQADGQEEVTSAPARALAIQAATPSLGVCGLSNTPTPYPVDENGESSDELILGRGGRVAGYRADYKLMGRG